MKNFLILLLYLQSEHIGSFEIKWRVNGKMAYFIKKSILLKNRRFVQPHRTFESKMEFQQYANEQVTTKTSKLVV